MLIILVVLTFMIGPGALMAQHSIKKLVIDAGHGGKDPGASGKHSKEKDIALSIALKAGEYIEDYYDDVEVIYTRKKDVFVELYRRAEIANEKQADLFISIHCNANPSSRPYGAETYVMGLHKSQANLEVARAENAAILLENDYSANYEGFDPNSPEANIIFSLYQNIHLEQSLNIASKIQTQFRERVKRHDRGVKQAGFWVLYKTTMPGILVEAGFLSNPTEEKFLNSKSGQTYIASAIFRAFREYKEDFEKKNHITAKEEKTSSAKEKQEMVAPPAPSQLHFSVQFASYNKPKALTSRRFKGLEKIKEYEHMGLFKYCTGEYGSFAQASAARQEVTRKGFKDAFVVAFYKEERISIKEALEIYDREQSSSK